jgi:hypothetical protein
MRKIIVHYSASWIADSQTSDVLEINDGDDAEEIARERVMEQIDWYWDDYKEALK